ncbi:MAG: hypothetical protein ACPLRM_03040, partial [Anaerolineae bacterium]
GLLGILLVSLFLLFSNFSKNYIKAQGTEEICVVTIYNKYTRSLSRVSGCLSEPYRQYCVSIIGSAPSKICATQCLDNLGTCLDDCNQAYSGSGIKFDPCSVYNVQYATTSKAIKDEVLIVSCYHAIKSSQKVCSVAAKSQYNDGRSTNYPQGYLLFGTCNPQTGDCMAYENLNILCCRGGELGSAFRYDADQDPPYEGWCNPGYDKVAFVGSASPGTIAR